MFGHNERRIGAGIGVFRIDCIMAVSISASACNQNAIVPLRGQPAAFQSWQALLAISLRVISTYACWGICSFLSFFVIRWLIAITAGISAGGKDTRMCVAIAVGVTQAGIEPTPLFAGAGLLRLIQALGSGCVLLTLLTAQPLRLFDRVHN